MKAAGIVRRIGNIERAIIHKETHCACVSVICLVSMLEFENIWILNKITDKHKRSCPDETTP